MSSNTASKKTHLLDSPITSKTEDSLGRADIAYNFAELIREIDSSQGLTVGILGPWGHGKSSFINLMKEQFSTDPALTVIDFNPWMYSGSDQLVSFFFSQLGAGLKLLNKNRFANIADLLSNYAGILKPISNFIPVPAAGLTVEAVTALIKGTAESTDADRSLTTTRNKITEKLAKLDDPIIVVIDDIDRLTTTEIREIFKLVRLTASFPNIVYLLSFDRERVEKALSEDGIPGRAYLEKMIQLNYDIPQAPQTLMRDLIIETLNQAIKLAPNAIFDEERWPEIFSEIIEPLLTTMRDVSRYTISARFAIKSLGEQINVIDLFALEVLRIFRPELLHALSRLRIELTTPRNPMSSKCEATQNKISELIEKNPEDKELVRSVVSRLFPAAHHYLDGLYFPHGTPDEWRISHRIANTHYLGLYLEHVADNELCMFRRSEHAFTLLGDTSKLKEYLTGLRPNQQEEVIRGLASHASKFTDTMVIPTSITLLNLIDSIPRNESRGIFSFHSVPATVKQVVVKLLEIISEEPLREEKVQHILDEIETYSSQLELIQTVGHQENLGRKLVSENFATQIEKEFVGRVLKTPPENPAREWDAWRVYDTVQAGTGTIPLKADSDPSLLNAVFSSLRSAVFSYTSSTRQQHTEPCLSWELLVKLFGSEKTIKNAVNNVRASLGDNEVLRLVDKYLEGWRPEEKF